MRVKQQTLKGFECEVDSTEEFIQYYTKNAPLMQGHLLILQGNVDDEVKAFLNERNIAFIDNNKTSLQTRKKRTKAVLPEPNLVATFPNEKPVYSDKIEMIFYRTIRSGEAIHVDDNLVFFGRINSGAVIESASSIQTFGIIDGLVRCDGEYIIIKKIGLGSVFFHGEELDKSQFNGQLKFVNYKNSAIEIKEI